MSLSHWLDTLACTYELIEHYVNHLLTRNLVKSSASSGNFCYIPWILSAAKFGRGRNLSPSAFVSNISLLMGLIEFNRSHLVTFAMIQQILFLPIHDSEINFSKYSQHEVYCDHLRMRFDRNFLRWYNHYIQFLSIGRQYVSLFP